MEEIVAIVLDTLTSCAKEVGVENMVQCYVRPTAVDRPGKKKMRPGPDVIGRATASRKTRAPEKNAAGESVPKPNYLEIQLLVAHAARRRLIDVPMVSLVSVAPGGELMVTSKMHADQQAANGLQQCTGCGDFFSHPRAAGLKTHQRTAREATCTEAGFERENREQLDALHLSCVGSTKESSGNDDGGGAKRRLEISRKYQAPWREVQRAQVSTLVGGTAQPCTTDGEGSQRDPEWLKASRDGNLEILVKLHIEGWDPAAEMDRYGNGPLSWAAGSGHLEVCKWLVSFGGCDVNRPAKKDGRLALHWASRNGKLDVVKYLVEGGLSGGSKLQALTPVTAETADGDTPFMLAAWQGHLELCKWLVARGGPSIPHAKNRWGCNAAFKVTAFFKLLPSGSTSMNNHLFSYIHYFLNFVQIPYCWEGCKDGWISLIAWHACLSPRYWG